MRPLFPLALLAGSLVILTAGCGHGDDGRSAGIIHRLLLAAGTEDSGALESFVGELPDGLPVTPPLYRDADLIVSSRQPAPVGDLGAGADPDASGGSVPQPTLYLIVLDTNDAREPVFAFYEEMLDVDPWQLESSFSTEQLDTLQFSNVEDIDIIGVVSIAHGGEDEGTSILISLQDAGAFLEEEPPFELGASLLVPKAFPRDVPLYRGSTVTDTAFFREPRSESFLLIFLTTDSQEDVIGFYREEFGQRGWKVTEGAGYGLEERIDFRDESSDIQGQVLADRFSPARSYTEVTIQVQVNPARDANEPGEKEATPARPTPTASSPSGALGPS